ncbi:MAG: YegS/Rv2252/BmrU family lipid kinase [Deltaproteobacteria bacterium]|nr:YegS/Rv2252/BmrU family lipid kinase [Deltaproteobacteria bacterium]
MTEPSPRPSSRSGEREPPDPARGGPAADRPLLIVNPNAGGGRTGKQLATIRPVIERALGACELAPTAGPGDAIRIAREATQAKRSLVIAIGGDGTVHEVVNGVVEGGGTTPVGIIGTGTGGDFTKTLRIAHRLDHYLAAIKGGKECRVDVGLLTYRDHQGAERKRYFANILSMGVGGMVDQYVANASRTFGSTLAYASASVRAIRKSALADVRLRITSDDGKTRTETLATRLAAICNGQFFGSGMQVAPMAQPDDGRFELLVLTATGRIAMMLGMRQIYTGDHVKRADIRHEPITAIEASLVDERLTDRFLLDVDGEPLGTLPIKVELVRAAVAMRVP